MKHTHRSGKKANEVPRSSTFKSKKSPVAPHSTYSKVSKRKS